MSEQPRSRWNEQFWEKALERAQLGLWDWDLNSGSCSYSATWANMLGYQSDELTEAADLWLTMTHPDDRQRAFESGERHIAGLSNIIETELRLRHKNGHWIWVLDRGGVIETDESGKALRVVGVQTDISKQKAAENALEEVNARFRLALAASGTGIWHYDIDSGRSYWDARTREIFGVGDDAAEDISKDFWHSFLHVEDKEAAEREHLAPLTTSDLIISRYRIVRRDGSIRHIESFLRFVPRAETGGQILGTVQDVTEEEVRNRELAFAARHDALTGLLNRAAYDKCLQQHFQTVSEHPVAVFYIDLDYFKAVNDFAGHAAGDHALRTIASAIHGCLPPDGHAARLGGDEFSVMVANCDRARAEAVAANLLEAIRNSELGGPAMARPLAASIGIKIVDDGSLSPSDALACADDACYVAKSAGGNRFSAFSDAPNASTSGLNAARMASEMLEALPEGRLLLYGQELRTLDNPREHSASAEVLARLTGRDGRIIAPSDFIPPAERFGVAATLDRWILRKALTCFGNAMASGPFRLAFNLSAQTLSDPNLWPFVDQLIEETGAPHRQITFEITETAAVTNFAAAERFVASARERHCRISLDDFGAGLSSFDYLRRFPIDSIKINGSFVQRMATNKFDREIVRSINGIAKGLGYEVIAEWIDNEAVLEMLQEMGVTYGQGFLLHKPEPLEALLGLCPGSKCTAAAE